MGAAAVRAGSFSVESHQRAAAAEAGGAFDDELVPINGLDRDQPRPDTTLETLAGLRPAFEDPAMAKRFPEIDWKITAGNSSPINNACSFSVMITMPTIARELGLEPKARLHHLLGGSATIRS